MNLSASRRTWEEASSPAAVRLARKYEQAWHGSNGSSQRPDLHDFLQEAALTLDGPGARLAVLRADMSLRWETGEKVSVEWYLDRYDNLEEDTLVALIYEEFCLREEDLERPMPAEYLARFPQVAEALGRVLDIHELVGSGTTASTFGLQTDVQETGGTRAAFPEAGQTIAGFYLVEELGRGSFARVFLARERQLADRPVALKVSWRGSREPQTLARLQHTHIVPVHSYRIDTTTGLHLLCMPYFGRMTLARLLADPQVQEADTGTALVLALDRLEPAEIPASRSSTGRASLEQRSYVHAIAWWGARLAEALDHAHDRGVLHRDIKPSNVLVTSDGMPMLLDFNLACDPVLEDGPAAPTTLGGTVDYMAPEHLKSLASGCDEKVDRRADLYGLGVVLFEALIGRKPFPSPRKGSSIIDVLLNASDDRSGTVPRLRHLHPEVPPALEAVVRHCLDPDPDHRYQSAGELAADLQAVADDLPLRHAREPWSSKTACWFRRRRRTLSMAAGILMAAAIILCAWLGTLLNRHEEKLFTWDEYLKGEEALKDGEYPTAKLHFDRIGQSPERSDVKIWNLVTGQSNVRDFARGLWTKIAVSEDPIDLEELKDRGRTKSKLAEDYAQAAEDARDVFEDGSSLRFRLLNPEKNDLQSASIKMQEVLKPFYVLQRPNWTDKFSIPMNLLTESTQDKLKNEVNELLFLWIAGICEEIGANPAAADQASESSKGEIVARAIDCCDHSLVWANPAGPWQALKIHLLAAAATGTQAASRAPRSSETALFVAEPPNIADEESALACFQWGLLCCRAKRHLRAIDWLKRAVQLNSGNYWYQYFLAYLEDKNGHLDLALNHYSVALALRPGLPRVQFSRARLYRAKGHYDLAIVDLEDALNKLQNCPEASQVQLELGYLYQVLGDFARARNHFNKIIDRNPSSDVANAARLDRACIDAESGAIERARAEYDQLIANDPRDPDARFSRALLELRLGNAMACENDLTALLDMGLELKKRHEVLATRALDRLILGRAEDAFNDANAALKQSASRAHERLRQRTLLATRRIKLIQLDRPDEIALLPLAGRPLTADLEAVTEDLKRLPQSRPEETFRALLNSAVISAALGKHDDAIAVANLAVKASPYSPRALLIRARILFFHGDARGALADVERGLSIQLNEPGLLELRGILQAARGEHDGALEDFRQALAAGALGQIHIHIASSLAARGRIDKALVEWGLALRRDPDLPAAFLGQAQCHIQLRQWDRALVDLEQAAALAHSDLGTELKILWAYYLCLAERPGHFERWLTLASQAARDVRGVMVKTLQKSGRSG